MAEPPAVEVANLAVRFRQRERTIHAVNGVSFRLARGEVLGILGESGCGKSVTLRALMRLLPANCEIDGRVKINGEDVTDAPTARLEELRGGANPDPAAVTRTAARAGHGRDFCDTRCRRRHRSQ